MLNKIGINCRIVKVEMDISVNYSYVLQLKEMEEICGLGISDNIKFQ